VPAGADRGRAATPRGARLVAAAASGKHESEAAQQSESTLQAHGSKCIYRQRIARTLGGERDAVHFVAGARRRAAG
jgi:hypothetical protein